MALNPVVFTEKVIRSFLRYQLTAYPFVDEGMRTQMHRLLSLDSTRDSPLLKGPYVSLSRSFRLGADIDELVRDGVFHPHMRQRIPAEISRLYGHQEEAIRAIRSGKTTLVSTGTGSGKTESFLYPIISKCLDLRDGETAPGVSAVIVYPMNALAEDQLGRLRSLLAGTGIPFGMYVGKTPEKEKQVAGIRLPAGASQADYEAEIAKVRKEKRSETVYPPEEVCSRESMRAPGRQPRILLTNVKQLELLLTRQQDIGLFADARLDFLVFDEAHTFTGAQGAETACLIRRLRTFCGANETVCVATSATIVDRSSPDAARDFAARFFGVPKDEVGYGERVLRARDLDGRPLSAAGSGARRGRTPRPLRPRRGRRNRSRNRRRRRARRPVRRAASRRQLAGCAARRLVRQRTCLSAQRGAGFSARAERAAPGTRARYRAVRGRSRDPLLADSRSGGERGRQTTSSSGAARLREGHRRSGDELSRGGQRPQAVAGRGRGGRRRERARAFSGDDMHHLRSALFRRLPQGLRIRRQGAGRRRGDRRGGLLEAPGGNPWRPPRRPDGQNSRGQRRRGHRPARPHQSPLLLPSLRNGSSRRRDPVPRMRDGRARASNCSQCGKTRRTRASWRVVFHAGRPEGGSTGGTGSRLGRFAPLTWPTCTFSPRTWCTTPNGPGCWSFATIGRMPLSRRAG